MRARVVVAAAAIFVAAGLVRADEQKVEKGDVPKAVLDTVAKKYPKAKMKAFSKETEKGKTVYEVAIEDGKRRIDVECSPEGKILAEEEVIEQSALPDAVKKALADSKYGKWDVKKCEKIVKEEKEDDAHYELLVASGDQKFEIVFDGKGKLIKEENKKAKKEEKDDDDD